MDASLQEHPLEVLQGLVVVKVDGVQDFQQPGRLDKVHAVLLLDVHLAPLQFLNGLQDGGLGLVPADGRQLGELLQHLVQQGSTPSRMGAIRGKKV